MKQENRQKGSGLLLLLLFLLSGSLLWSREVVSVQGGSMLSLQHARAESQRLQSSRQALLTYSALYPFLYGPRGAGPGHFPCPDTDALGFARSHHPSPGDGPNPPCSRGEILSGLLPRHISLPSHRYAFDTSASGIHTYSVSGSVINNPLDRLVNPELANQMGSQDPYVVRVVSEHVGGKLMAPISATALLQAVQPALLAWTSDRLRALSRSACLQSAYWYSIHQTENNPTMDTENRCDPVLERILECSFSNLTVLHPDQNGAEYPAIGQTQDGRSRDSLLQQTLWAVLLLDDLPDEFDCSENVLSIQTVEAVPLPAHWFFRNRWHQWLTIRPVLTDECPAGKLPGCEFSLGIASTSVTPASASAEQ